MISNEETNQYYCLKYILALIFDTKEKTYKDSDLIRRVDVIECLKDLVEIYVENNFFSREINDQDSCVRIKLVNDIIRILNLQKEAHSLYFYAVQLSVRKNDKGYLNKYDNYTIKKEIDSVNDSIVEDFIVLSMLNSSVTDDETFKMNIEDFLADDSFYDNINILLSEWPSLFKDKTFCERIKYVLDYNKKESKEYNKLNRILMKKIRKSNNTKA